MSNAGKFQSAVDRDGGCVYSDNVKNRYRDLQSLATRNPDNGLNDNTEVIFL